MNNFYSETEYTDHAETEALRERLINELEGAYFSGIGTAMIKISEVKRANKEELLCMAQQWGIEP